MYYFKNSVEKDESVKFEGFIEILIIKKNKR